MLFHLRCVTSDHARVHGAPQLLSLVTFFAAAKKVTPAPGKGMANRPKAKQVSRQVHAHYGVHTPLLNSFNF
jgi:hypothetical protein